MEDVISHTVLATAPAEAATSHIAPVIIHIEVAIYQIEAATA